MSLLQRLRGMLTLLLAPFLTFLVSLFALVDMMLVRRSESKAQFFPRYWGRALCRLAGVRVRVEGLERLDPEATYIFAGNHVSQFDIFAFQGYFPHDFRWIAKKELFQIPLFGQAMERIGYIPIDRSQGRQALKSLDEAAARIASGSSVLIFPEGTRSDNGRLQEFKAGAILLAIKAGVPIAPIGFNGSYEVLPKGALVPKSGCICMRIGPALDTSQFKAKEKQQLTQQLHQAVQQQLEPRYQATEPPFDLNPPTA